MHDLRFAFRFFLRRPVASLVMLATLAGGLAATVAAFAVVDQVLLREPALLEPERLVVVHEVSRSKPDERRLVPPADFLDLRESPLFTSAGAWMSWNFNLSGQGTPERLRGAIVSEDFFATLGRTPLAGRTTGRADAGGGTGAVVISHGLWQRAFGGDDAAVGRQITLSGERFTIAGVMPAGFHFPDRETELWIPLVWGTHFERDDRAGGNLRVVARLRDGLEMQEAEAGVRTLLSRIESASPATHAGISASIERLSDAETREIRTTLLLILAAATTILLVGCANVGNLMLMSGASRRRELATRLVLGGGRLRLLRAAVVEGGLLGITAAGIGLPIAVLALRALGEMHLPIPEVSLDARTAAIAIAGALLAGIASAMIPALLFSRGRLIDGLRYSHQVASTGGALRGSLVVAQVAMTCALLVAAGMLVKSFQRLSDVDPGFDPSNIVTARIWLPSTYESATSQSAFYSSLLTRLDDADGVKAAGTVQDLPLRGNAMTFDIEIEGMKTKAAYRVVSGHYFEVMRIPIVRGRGFDSGDRAGAPSVFLVNGALARQAFGRTDPVGRRVRVGDDGAWGTIAGVVGDVKQMGLDAGEVPAIYQPDAQREFAWLRWTTIVLRTSEPLAAMKTRIRAEVMSLDPALPAYDIVTLEEVVAESVAKQRLSAWVVGALGGVAFLIALIGIAGVLSYSVALRARELGVRLALGATPARLVRHVLDSASRLVLPGIAAGLAAAAALSPFIEHLLFEVNTADPRVYSGVALAILLAAALAALVPARRAASVDPATTLRAE